MSCDPSPDEDLAAALRRAAGRLSRRLRALRRGDEPGESALDVLGTLRREGPASPSALHDRLRVTPATMSQALGRLERDGLVRRARDATDGRRVLVALTPDGVALVEDQRARGSAWLDERLAGLDAQERATLAQAVRLIYRLTDD